MPNVIYGNPEEWEAFANRHPELVARLGNIPPVEAVAFKTPSQFKNMAHVLVYFLGRTLLSEFMEILTLCANGYGLGADKLLRAMYERAVTARYLFQNQDEAQDFIDYYVITKLKVFRILKEEAPALRFPPDHEAELEAKVAAIKGDGDRFTTTLCKKCGTKRPMHSWNKKDLVSMARTFQPESTPLRGLLSSAYVMPTQEFHTSMSSIFSRLDLNVKGMMFNDEDQRAQADNVLAQAHLIMLEGIQLQYDCFEDPELLPLLKPLADDYQAIWVKYSNENPEETRL